MTTLHIVELGVLGPLQVRRDSAPVTIPGAKPRAVLTMLGLHSGSVVSADTLFELLWSEDPPRTAAKALQTHTSSLRRAPGDGVVVTREQAGPSPSVMSTLRVTDRLPTAAMADALLAEGRTVEIIGELATAVSARASQARDRDRRTGFSAGHRCCTTTSVSDAGCDLSAHRH